VTEPSTSSATEPALFDAYGDTYRDAVQSSISFAGASLDHFTEMKAKHLLDLCRRHLGDPARQRALDVGCGVGVTDRLLVEHIGDLHGVDVSSAEVARAAQDVPAATYQHYDGARLPHPDGSFDLSFCINVIHHVPVPQWPSFVAELARVVRPGGLVAVFEHNRFNPLTRRAVAACEFDVDATLVPRRRLRRLAQDAGLTPIESPYIVFLPFGGPAAFRIDRALRGLPAGAQYYLAARRP
jgi:SAM-dependent methyltransferase